MLSRVQDTCKLIVYNFRRETGRKGGKEKGKERKEGEKRGREGGKEERRSESWKSLYFTQQTPLST